MKNLKQLPTQEESNSESQPIGPGTYPAVVWSVVDLGVQINDYDKKNPKNVDQVWVTYMLPTELGVFDGEELPRVIGKSYNVPKAYNEKSALIQLFETLGKEGDETIADLLNAECMVTTGLTKNKKDKILGVSQLVKGMAVDACAGSFVIEQSDWDDSTKMDQLPTFIQDMIANRVV